MNDYQFLRLLSFWSLSTLSLPLDIFCTSSACGIDFPKLTAESTSSSSHVFPHAIMAHIPRLFKIAEWRSQLTAAAASVFPGG